MINLNVKPYCDNCGDFEPEVEKTEFEKFYGGSKCQTEIMCKNRRKCENIMQYLKEEMERNGRE